MKIHTACYLFNLFPSHEQKEECAYEKAEIEDIGQRVYYECQEGFISKRIVFPQSANSQEPNRTAKKHDYRHCKTK